MVRQIISNLGWQAREAGQPLPEETNGSLYRQYLKGFRLRFDFKFEMLGAHVQEWSRARPGDALFLALSGFAGLGRGSMSALRSVERSVGSPNADSVSRSVCLHALWFANHIPDQAERIIQLSDQIISRGEDGANLYYWRAFAFRRLQRFDEALESIDIALDLHPPGMNLVHQDYVRERALIATTKLILSQMSDQAQRISAELRDDLLRRVESAKVELMTQSDKAQKVVSDSLLKLVEVLGLFVTLAGFLIGSGAVVFRASGFWQNFVGVSLILVGSIAFFTMLRFVVRFKSRRS